MENKQTFSDFVALLQQKNAQAEDSVGGVEQLEQLEKLNESVTRIREDLKKRVSGAASMNSIGVASAPLQEIVTKITESIEESNVSGETLEKLSEENRKLVSEFKESLEKLSDKNSKEFQKAYEALVDAADKLSKSDDPTVSGFGASAKEKLVDTKLSQEGYKLRGENDTIANRIRRSFARPEQVDPTTGVAKIGGFKGLAKNIFAPKEGGLIDDIFTSDEDKVARESRRQEFRLAEEQATQADISRVSEGMPDISEPENQTPESTTPAAVIETPKSPASSDEAEIKAGLFEDPTKEYQEKIAENSDKQVLLLEQILETLNKLGQVSESGGAAESGGESSGGMGGLGMGALLAGGAFALGRGITRGVKAVGRGVVGAGRMVARGAAGLGRGALALGTRAAGAIAATGVGGAAIEGISGAARTAQSMGGAAINTARGVVGTGVQAASRVASNAGQMLSGAARTAQSMGGAAINTARGVVGTGVQAAGRVASNAGQMLSGAARTAGGAVAGAAKTAGGAVAGAAKTAGGAAVKGLGMAARVAGKLAAPLAIGMAAYDAFKGFNADENATTGQKFQNAGRNVLSGLTFGLVDSTEDKMEDGSYQLDRLVEKAEDEGLYDKDYLGDSEIDKSKLAETTDIEMLNAILADDDLNEEDTEAVQARIQAIQSGEADLSPKEQEEKKKEESEKESEKKSGGVMSTIGKGLLAATPIGAAGMLADKMTGGAVSNAFGGLFGGATAAGSLDQSAPSSSSGMLGGLGGVAKAALSVTPIGMAASALDNLTSAASPTTSPNISVPPPTVITQGDGGAKQVAETLAQLGNMKNVRANDSSWRRFQDRRSFG